MPTVHDVIVHCQKQIKKEPPEEKLLHYLNRLDRLRVTVQDLMDTGVGRTVNQLSRHDAEVGHYASKLVKKWKAMVSDENSEESEDSQSSSSSGESEDDEEVNGQLERDAPLESVKRSHGHNSINGYKKHQNTEPYSLNGYDSNDGNDSDVSDRLCIADEDANNAKMLSKTIDQVVIPSIIPSSSSESDSEEMLTQRITENPKSQVTQSAGHNYNNSKSDRHQHVGNNLNNNEEPVKHNHHKVKVEKLSGSDDDDSSAELYPTQVLRKKSHKDNYSRTYSDEELNHYPSTQPVQPNELVIKKEYRKSKKSDRSSSSRKHHREGSRERHKKAKEKHHSGDRDTGREHRRNESLNVKVKIEPGLDDGARNEIDTSQNHHHSSKHREREKSNQRIHEKESKDTDKHRSKEHRKKDKHSRRSKSEEERRDNKPKETEVPLERKRKRDEGNDKEKSINFSSPDRKKMKPEDINKKYKDRAPSKKPSIHIDEEIDSKSGVKFEELLGCLDTSLKKKDKNKDKPPKSTSHSSSKDKEEVTKLVRRKDLNKSDERKERRKHLESIIAPTLNISPNYKPSTAAASLLSRPISMLPPKPQTASLNVLETCDPGNYWEDSRITLNNCAREYNAEDALSSMMSSRNQRTKVFSGKSIGHKGQVPQRLYDMCMQVIQENIHDLGYTGGIPYDILKPALERATSQQLLQIEECNPYLIGETDDLWKFHCSREFRGHDRQELETWRELFERCMFERDQKFAIVKRKMLKKVEVAEPVRKAKLAYVEPIGGPRFNRKKAATIKNGMKSLKIKEEKGPKKGVGSSASVGFNNPTDSSRIVEEQAVIINPESRAGHAPAPSVSRNSGESTARMKPRRAPLMAKTMKFIKTLQRR